MRQHLEATTDASSATSYVFDQANYPIAAHGDSLVYFTANNSGNYFVVSKLGADGVFSEVAIKKVDYITYFTMTNGKWYGYLGGYGAELFQLDADNNIYNETSVVFYSTTYYLNMLEDGTIVAVIGDTIKFFAWNDSTSAFVESPNSIYVGSTNRISVWANLDTLVSFNSSMLFQIYKKDQSAWNLIDEFTSPTQDGTSIFDFNGVDAIAIPHSEIVNGDTLGLIEIFTKVGSEWIVQQFYPNDIGATLFPNFRWVKFVNNDTVLITASIDGVTNLKRGVSPGTSEPFGSVYVFQRQQNNTWSATAKFTSKENQYFGTQVQTTTKKLVFLGCNELSDSLCKFYSAPSCIVAPAEATCSSLQSDTCQVDLENLNPYTLTGASAECSSTVSSSVTGVKFEDYTFTIGYKFEALLGSPYYCNATLSCPAPVIPQAPVAATVPVSTPTKKTSASSAVAVASVAVGIALLALF